MSLKPIINYPINKTGRLVCNWEAPKDLTDLRYALSIQHLTPKVIGQKLDKNSTACKYFGVDTLENIIKNLNHHEKLNKANEFWRTSNNQRGNIINLGTMSFRDLEIEKEFLHKGGRIGLYGRPWTLIDEIKSQGAAKITFIDKI